MTRRRTKIIATLGPATDDPSVLVLESVISAGADVFHLNLSHGNAEEQMKRVSVSHAQLADDVDVGDDLLLDDGLISMQVRGVADGQIECEVKVGGVLPNRKGINLRETINQVVAEVMAQLRKSS